MRTAKENKSLYLLAFIIPVAIMLFIFIIRGIYPFGDESFLHIDMYHQYFPFLVEFFHKLKEGDSLFYSWNTGLGSNFLALYVYYLASPFNWLVIFCPENLLIEFITYFIVIKIGLSSLTFTYYLNKHFNRKDFSILFFSIFYAMSGYYAAYNWNVMWLDCIVLAPLIILGLERLVKEGKYKLYCITLALAILSNYYISIMICIYLVLYFFVLLITCKDRWKAFINFALYSLLAGGMAAVLLIPELAALHYSEFASFNFPKEVSTYFSIMDVLARHCVNVTVETGLNHWPNLYCGVAVLFLLPLYTMNKTIPTNEKIGKLSLLAFMIISFATNILNFIWHGFNYPDSLPCRQSFLYIILVLTLSYEALYHIKEYSKSEMTYSICGVMFFILLCEKLTDVENIASTTYLLTGVLLLFYAIMMYQYRKENASRQFILYITLFIVIVESAVNMLTTSVPTVSRSNYIANMESGSVLSSKIKSEDTALYRIEKFERLTQNDAMLSNFSSATCFSSTSNSHVKDFYNKYGMKSSRVFYSFEGATPVTSALLNTKYMLSKNELESDSLYNLVAEDNGTYLYENTYQLPFGYVIDASDLINSATTKGASDNFAENDFETTESHSSEDDLFESIDEVLDEKENEETLISLNPLESQNELLSKCNITDPVFDPISTETIDNTTSFTVETNSHVYAYSNNRKVTTVVALLGDKSKTFKKLKNSYIMDMGYLPAGTVVTVNCTEPVDTPLNLSAYSLNETSLQAWIQTLSEQPIVIDSYDSTNITGHITVKKDGPLVLSFPYEPGWTLKVDNQKTDIELFEDTLISVPLTAGTHTIELNFYPAGLNIGLAISLLCLFLFIGIIYFSKHPLPFKSGEKAKLHS